jgi:hypothetical protein
MYSPRWHLTLLSALQDALSLFHFLWRKLPLHMFHEGLLRDFQSMSASLSRSREAILCIWCPSQAQRMIRDTGHALANQNIAVFIFPAPCLALIFDVAFECLRPADSELCGYGIIKLLKQRPYTPFILALVTNSLLVQQQWYVLNREGVEGTDKSEGGTRGRGYSTLRGGGEG